MRVRPRVRVRVSRPRQGGLVRIRPRVKVRVRVRVSPPRHGSLVRVGPRVRVRVRVRVSPPRQGSLQPCAIEAAHVRDRGRSCM